ncbi:MAG TPA: cytochrome c [Gammaproteobacteria bacterium]|nr:cytochrome c [Gammaproteobacteria bacterium]
MKKVALLCCMLVIPAVVLAWPWSRDLMNQPSIKPQEAPVGSFPTGSVPVGGPWTRVEDRDATEEIKNPVPISPQSLATGKALYITYCLPCHGENGKGDGLVGKVFETQPADLTSDYVKNDITDGWIWGTITFGSYIMPRYSYDLSPQERWDVVNYVRKILGRRMTVKTREQRATQIMRGVVNKGKE